MFFTGDFNAHSPNCWPEGTTNNEGIAIDNLSSALDLNQIIREPTQFEEKKISVVLILGTIHSWRQPILGDFYPPPPPPCQPFFIGKMAFLNSKSTFW